MRSSKRAFSLLEVVIAVFVFITTVAGVLSVWTAHARGIEKARMTLIANQLGEELMAECMAARFELVSQLDNVTGPAPPPLPVEVDFIVKDKPLSAKFFTSVEVTDLTPTIKQVKVRVEWTDTTNSKAGSRSSVEFITELHESA